MNRRSFLLRTGACAAYGALATRMKADQETTPPSGNALRDKLMHDILRPQYHLVPQGGFVGDPCAPRWFQGNYHVFFHGDFGGRGWAHAMSPDLIHWKHLPVALSPTDGSFDSYGCFTGSVFPADTGACVVYTGVTRVPRAQETIRAEGLREVQCIATSQDPDLRTWHKAEKPVIEMPPQGEKIVGFRDPFSWKDGDTWYIGVGSGFAQKGGAVLLYRSRDAQHWEYVHPLAEGVWNQKSYTNPVGSAEMWECPDFFALGDKHVLLYSSEYITYWEVGTFDKDDLRFNSLRRGFLDHGAYYAPKSMIDGRGRRILWGWVQETRSREASRSAGWSGAISLPRELSLGPANELRMNVPAEFGSLQTERAVIRSPRSAEELSQMHPAAQIHHRSGVVTCTFKVQSGDYALELRDASGEANVALFKVTSGVSIGSSPTLIVADRTLELRPDTDGLSTLELWVDGSIFELYVDRTQVMTIRCYEGGSDIDVRWTGAPQALQSLVVSDVAPVSIDRLTL